MNVSLLLSTACTLTPLVATPCIDTVYELHFQPSEGLELETRMSCETSMNSERFEVEMGGQPVPAQFLPPLEMSLENSTSLVVQDHFKSVQDGQATLFVRHYESFVGKGAFNMSMGPGTSESEDWDSEAEADGAEVEFSWNAEEERFDRRMLDVKKQPLEIEQYDAQLSLAAFLPDEPVGIGSEWSLEVGALEALLEPGGAAELNTPHDPEQEAFERLSSSGELRAVLKSVREQEGVRVAVISLSATYNSREQRPTNLDRVPVASGSALESTSRDLELEGELLWNLDAGRAVSLELKGQLEHESRTVKEEGQEGPSYSSLLSFGGEVYISVAVQELD